MNHISNGVNDVAKPILENVTFTTDQYTDLFKLAVAENRTLPGDYADLILKYSDIDVHTALAYLDTERYTTDNIESMKNRLKEQAGIPNSGGQYGAVRRASS